MMSSGEMRYADRLCGDAQLVMATLRRRDTKTILT
jgi:hypothetical protein